MIAVPFNGKRLKRWLFPSPEERARKQAEREAKEIREHEQRIKELDISLAQAKRANLLAEKEAELQRLTERTQRLRARFKPKQAGLGLDFEMPTFKKPKFEAPKFFDDPSILFPFEKPKKRR